MATMFERSEALKSIPTGHFVRCFMELLFYPMDFSSGSQIIFYPMDFLSHGFIPWIFFFIPWIFIPWEILGTPNNGTPIPILLPYHSHKNPLIRMGMVWVPLIGRGSHVLGGPVSKNSLTNQRFDKANIQGSTHRIKASSDCR